MFLSIELLIVHNKLFCTGIFFLDSGSELVCCKCTTGCTASKSCFCKQLGRDCTSVCHPNCKCKRLSSTSKKPVVIDLVCVGTPSKIVTVWVKLCSGYDLLSEDKLLLLNGQWLNDRIINGWQMLLRRNYPNARGLPSTVAISNRRFKRNFGSKSGLVQVLNSSNKHWVAVSTIGLECHDGSVHWLDS